MIYMGLPTITEEPSRLEELDLMTTGKALL